MPLARQLVSLLWSQRVLSAHETSSNKNYILGLLIYCVFYHLRPSTCLLLLCSLQRKARILMLSMRVHGTVWMAAGNKILGCLSLLRPSWTFGKESIVNKDALHRPWQNSVVPLLTMDCFVHLDHCRPSVPDHKGCWWIISTKHIMMVP